MPPSLSIGTFVLGAVLLLIALTDGGVKIFGADVAGASKAGAKVAAGVIGALLILVGLWTSFDPKGPVPNPKGPVSPSPQASDPCKDLPRDHPRRPIDCK